MNISFCFYVVTLCPITSPLAVLRIAYVEKGLWKTLDILSNLATGTNNDSYDIQEVVIVNVCSTVLVELNSLFAIKISL